MSLKQAYENSQPKNINDFFLANSVNRNRRSATKNSNFFNKLMKSNTPNQ